MIPFMLYLLFPMYRKTPPILRKDERRKTLTGVLVESNASAGSTRRFSSREFTDNRRISTDDNYLFTFSESATLSPLLLYFDFLKSTISMASTKIATLLIRVSRYCDHLAATAVSELHRDSSQAHKQPNQDTS